MLSRRQPGTLRLTTNGLLIAAVLFTLSVIMAPYIRIQTYLLTENLRPAVTSLRRKHGWRVGACA